MIRISIKIVNSTTRQSYAILMMNPDLIVDANLPRKYVEELRSMGFDVLYINEWDSSMPDSQVKAIGYKYNAPIATCNVKHFLDFFNLIPLKPKRWDKQVNETLKYLDHSTVQHL